MRIIFMGSPDFSVPSLRALQDAGHDILCVYAQPPRPAGRGHKERPCPVHAAALEMGMSVRTPENFKSKNDRLEFAELNADLAVVVAYGLILPKEVLEAPSMGCINVHASLLPRWRGAAPIQRAILAGDTQSGVCIMAMDEGLDTGAVYARSIVPITLATTGGSLHDTLSEVGARACMDVVGDLSGGTAIAIPQSSDGVTYAKKLSPAEARVDWQQSAEVLARMVKAFDPWPGTWFEHNEERIKLLDAQYEPFQNSGQGFDTSHTPGEIIDNRPAIACREGVLVPTRMQRSGRKAQDVAEFMRGYNLGVGEILK